MNLYALDSESGPVFADLALKHKDYFCLECKGILRLRGGMHRQNHFYHVDSNRVCHQMGKGMPHLQTQLYFFHQLPKGECQLEHRFPEINRIADVVWTARKIVFEIQCSPISKEEVMARIRDYHSIGFHTIWILHDQRFNKWRQSAAENSLQNHPHYYTNINVDGKGSIYDQYSCTIDGIKKFFLPPLSIQIDDPLQNPLPFHLPARILKERKSWLYAFTDDLTTLPAHHPYLEKIQEFENRLAVYKNPYVSLFEKWILRPYRILFYTWLEKSSR